jgi:hypothetical protein
VKILPCQRKEAGPSCRDGIAKLDAAGDYYYTLGRWPGGQPFIYQCRACHRTSHLTAAEYNALPNRDLTDLPEKQQLHLAKDLTLGGEIPLAQAHDLAKAGFQLGDVVKLSLTAPAPRV